MSSLTYVSVLVQLLKSYFPSLFWAWEWCYIPHYVYSFLPVSTFLLWSGIVDSSGMEFFYTTTPPQQRAGILAVGHLVSNIMIIPPNAENFTVTSLCPGSCTRSVSALYTSLYYVQLIWWWIHSRLSGNINHASDFRLQFIPPDGITVFGNGLHTHLVGMYGGQFHFSVSVALHYRYSKCLCNCV